VKCDLYKIYHRNAIPKFPSGLVLKRLQLLYSTERNSKEKDLFTMRIVLTSIVLFLFMAANAAAQKSFTVQQISDGLYAAIAKPGGHATSNAFFAVGDHSVTAGGAHMTKEAFADLTSCITEKTPKPLRNFILAHHHEGLTFVDFDFPPDVQVIMSWQTWRVLQSEEREITYPILFFEEGLTFRPGVFTLVLSNLGNGHTAGDVVAYIPETKTLFASDLLYNDGVGYMGEGHMEEWVAALEFFETLEIDGVIPGFGPVGNAEDIFRYKKFFKDFLTEVIRHIDKGESIEKTLKTFSLPDHKNLKGYDRFLRANVERAYIDLKEVLASPPSGDR